MSKNIANVSLSHLPRLHEVIKMLMLLMLKVNRKVQGVPESQTATNPRSQEEEQKMKKKTKKKLTCTKQTNAREAHRPAPSSPSRVIEMLKGMTWGLKIFLTSDKPHPGSRCIS